MLKFKKLLFIFLSVLIITSCGKRGESGKEKSGKDLFIGSWHTNEIIDIQNTKYDESDLYFKKLNSSNEVSIKLYLSKQDKSIRIRHCEFKGELINNSIKLNELNIFDDYGTNLCQNIFNNSRNSMTYSKPDNKSLKICFGSSKCVTYK